MLTNAKVNAYGQGRSSLLQSQWNLWLLLSLKLQRLCCQRLLVCRHLGAIAMHVVASPATSRLFNLLNVSVPCQTFLAFPCCIQATLRQH